MCIAFWTSELPDDSPYSLFACSVKSKANRDEFHARRTAPLAWRSLHSSGSPPTVLCGLDLAAGGTWLGITETGCLALLTNFTEPVLSPLLSDGRPRPSRGALVADFLVDDQSRTPGQFCEDKKSTLQDYAGFNLLLVGLHPSTPRGHELALLTNRPTQLSSSSEQLVWNRDELRHGAVSNGHFDSDPSNPSTWAKIKTGSEAFKVVADSSSSNHQDELVDALLQTMSSPASTWDPLHRETVKTTVAIPPFQTTKPGLTSSNDIRGWYGTRSQAVILVRKTGQVSVVERQAWSAAGQEEPVWSGSVIREEFELR